MLSQFGKILQSPVPAPAISLEVDTPLPEKDNEVISVGFRMYTRRCGALRGRPEVEQKVGYVWIQEAVAHEARGCAEGTAPTI